MRLERSARIDPVVRTSRRLRFTSGIHYRKWQCAHLLQRRPDRLRRTGRDRRREQPSGLRRVLATPRGRAQDAAVPVGDRGLLRPRPSARPAVASTAVSDPDRTASAAASVSESESRSVRALPTSPHTSQPHAFMPSAHRAKTKKHPIDVPRIVIPNTLHAARMRDAGVARRKSSSSDVGTASHLLSPIPPAIGGVEVASKVFFPHSSH